MAYLDIGVLLLQVAASAGDGAASAHTRHQDVHLQGGIGSCGKEGPFWNHLDFT